jgi:hypothetical protein
MHTLKVIFGGFLLLGVCLLLGRWIGGAAATVVACPYRKCYPARMPLKSAPTGSIRANAATECNNVTCPAPGEITIRQPQGSIS